MSYQVLARKYRPRTFDEVVGQRAVVQILKNSISGGRIAHAYLFSGVRGVGKTTVARLLAKALNCVKGPTAEPCNECASCNEIAASSSLDVLEIDGASNNSVDDVRELRETVRYTPSRDRNRVIIIDEVHMLSNSAFNALLKTLEEPPPHVVFIFATTEYRKVPVTILSRCQHYEFRRIPRAEIAAHLAKICAAEKVEISAYALDLIARLADGSLRDSQTSLDQVIAYSGPKVRDEDARAILGVLDQDLMRGFVEKVAAKDAAGLLDIVDQILESGHDAAKFVSDLIGQFRDILLLKIVPDAPEKLGLARDEVEAMAPLAERFSQEDLLRLVDAAAREEARIRFSPQPRYLLEALAVRLCHLADLMPLEELLARFPPEEEGKRQERSQSGDKATPGPPPDGKPPSEAVPSSTAWAEASDASPLDPPSAAKAQGDPGESQRQVEAILEKLHAERGALGGFLSHASRFDLETGEFVITLPEDRAALKPSIERKEYLAVIRKAAEAVTGRSVGIKVRLIAPAPASEATVSRSDEEEREARKKRLLQEATRSPVVQSFLDLFPGEITDIEEV